MSNPLHKVLNKTFELNPRNFRLLRSFIKEEKVRIEWATPKNEWFLRTYADKCKRQFAPIDPGFINPFEDLTTDSVKMDPTVYVNYKPVEEIMTSENFIGNHALLSVGNKYLLLTGTSRNEEMKRRNSGRVGEVCSKHFHDCPACGKNHRNVFFAASNGRGGPGSLFIADCPSYSKDNEMLWASFDTRDPREKFKVELSKYPREGATKLI